MTDIATRSGLTPQRISSIRKQLGLSQEALARQVGVSVRTISRWELGVNRPHHALVERLMELVERGTADVRAQ